jgi:hypothetical protein
MTIIQFLIINKNNKNFMKDHLRFQISTKIHSRNIPAKFPFQWCNCFWEKAFIHFPLNSCNLIITMLITNSFRLEQKIYLPLKLQFISDFGKTTIFNGLLGNRPNVFCWASDYLIYTVNVIYCSPQLCIFIEPINTRFLHVFM